MVVQTADRQSVLLFFVRGQHRAWCNMVLPCASTVAATRDPLEQSPLSRLGSRHRCPLCGRGADLVAACAAPQTRPSRREKRDARAVLSLY